MKQFQLIQDYQGISKGTILYGRYKVTGGGTGYFQKENIPESEGGTQCIFSSAVESDTINFKEITENK